MPECFFVRMIRRFNASRLWAKELIAAIGEREIPRHCRIYVSEEVWSRWLGEVFERGNEFEIEAMLSGRCLVGQWAWIVRDDRVLGIMLERPPELLISRIDCCHLGVLEYSHA